MSRLCNAMAAVALAILAVPWPDPARASAPISRSHHYPSHRPDPIGRRHVAGKPTRRPTRVHGSTEYPLTNAPPKVIVASRPSAGTVQADDGHLSTAELSQAVASAPSQMNEVVIHAPEGQSLEQFQAQQQALIEDAAQAQRQAQALSAMMVIRSIAP